jgi:hypothetical protein
MGNRSRHCSPCGGGLDRHRSARGDGKGTQCPGHPVPGAYKYGHLALQAGGVSKTRTIKYALESRGTQTREGLR